MKDKKVTIDGVEYLEKKIDTGKQIAIVRERIPTESDIKANEDYLRKEKLRQLIADKKLLDLDCKDEQKELKELLKL